MILVYEELNKNNNVHDIKLKFINGTVSEKLCKEIQRNFLSLRKFERNYEIKVQKPDYYGTTCIIAFQINQLQIS